MSLRPECPVKGCQNRLPRGGWICGRCWKSLPEDIQRQVEVDQHELREARAGLRAARGDGGGCDDIAARVVLALRASRETWNRAIDAASFARRDWTIPAQLRGRRFARAA